MLFTKPKTVDSILSRFTEVAVDLDAFITTACHEMADHQVEINKHVDAIETKSAEVKRANAVLTQINKLIQG